MLFTKVVVKISSISKIHLLLAASPHQLATSKQLALGSNQSTR